MAWIFSKRQEKREAFAGANSESGKQASYKARIVQSGNEESALRIAAVYRAVEVRAQSLGMMRLRLLRKNPKGGNYEEANEDAYCRHINWLLQVRPNGRMNAFEFWERVERIRLLHGRCCILPKRGKNGMTQELIPCFGEYNGYANLYTLYERDFGINGEVFDGNDLIVLRNCVTRAFPEGQSTIYYAARTQNLNATIEQLSLENAAKGGRLKLILQQKEDGLAGLGGIAPEEMARQTQRLQDAIATEDVIWDASVSNITPINMNAVDLQLLDTRKFSVADIARFFGVPRMLLMDESGTAYKSVEETSVEYMCRTVKPMLERIESEFNGKMLTESDFGVYKYEFDTRNIYALNTQARSAFNKSRLETGVASVNELRQEMNMPRIEGGDEHYVTCNVAPVGEKKEEADGEK